MQARISIASKNEALAAFKILSTSAAAASVSFVMNLTSSASFSRTPPSQSRVAAIRFQSQ
jgi:hypothetical protein